MITGMGSYMMRIITGVHMYTRKAPLWGEELFLILIVSTPIRC